MEQYCVYLAIKQIMYGLSCPAQASAITYNSISLVTPNAVGVYFIGNTIQRNRILSTGAYCRLGNRVRLRMQTDKTASSILDWESFCNKLVKEAPKLNNVEYILDSNKIGFDATGNITRDKKDIVAGVKVVFIRTDPQTGVVNKGKSSQGLTRYRCDLAIEYNIASYALN